MQGLNVGNILISIKLLTLERSSLMRKIIIFLTVLVLLSFLCGTAMSDPASDFGSRKYRRLMDDCYKSMLEHSVSLWADTVEMQWLEARNDPYAMNIKSATLMCHSKWIFYDPEANMRHYEKIKMGAKNIIAICEYIYQWPGPAYPAGPFPIELQNPPYAKGERYILTFTDPPTEAPKCRNYPVSSPCINPILDRIKGLCHDILDKKNGHLVRLQTIIGDPMSPYLFGAYRQETLSLLRTILQIDTQLWDLEYRFPNFNVSGYYNADPLRSHPDTNSDLSDYVHCRGLEDIDDLGGIMRRN